MKRLIEMDLEHACRTAFESGAKKRAPGGPWWGDPPAEEAFSEQVDTLNYIAEMRGDPRYPMEMLDEMQRMAQELAEAFRYCANLQPPEHVIPLGLENGAYQPEVRQAVSHEGEC